MVQIGIVQCTDRIDTMADIEHIRTDQCGNLTQALGDDGPGPNPHGQEYLLQSHGCRITGHLWKADGELQRPFLIQQDSTDLSRPDRPQLPGIALKCGVHLGEDILDDVGDPWADRMERAESAAWVGTLSRKHENKIVVLKFSSRSGGHGQSLHRINQYPSHLSSHGRINGARARTDKY